MPDTPLLVSAKTWERIERAFLPLFEARHADTGVGVRLMMVALIRARWEHTFGRQLGLEAEWRPAPAWAVVLGGMNVTDRYPARSIDDIAYFGNLPYDVLSPVGFNGAFWYARLRHSF